MERWAGKVAIVTGASAGIGAATVEALVKKGLKVVAVARRLDRLEAQQKSLNGEKGEMHPFQADVSKTADVCKLFEWVKTKFGKVHILINNAGILRLGNIEEGNLQDFVDTINTNFIGLVACSQAALRLMRESGVDDGHIIHINSVAGHVVPNLGMTLNVYPSTKHAVTALTESMRQELNIKKSKIRVTSISPGYVDTEILHVSAQVAEKEVSDKFMSSAGSEIIASALQSEDITNAILFALAAPPHVQIHELIIKPLGSPA